MLLSFISTQTGILTCHSLKNLHFFFHFFFTRAKARRLKCVNGMFKIFHYQWAEQ